ncbi:hypothetical protein BCR35DRAFT_353684 [Leucosporidium creatinivorum]|uniref:Uncharacterized protein n=1 Tax=Leucosporidium creatinivorum TaxID=106004 RepID=A0A1Y2EUW5_9BASI|nr:hypothetical protein BCR35DRAFT_353684 [Leucosporidium creatinivorum]
MAKTPATPPRRSASTSLASPAPRGPLPSTSETSYHKRLRSILLDHKKCRKEWNELVIRGCLARTRAAIELWSDIENGLKVVNSKKGGQSSAVRAGYLFAQSARLSEQLATINAVVSSLTDLVATMSQLAERAEALTVEAAKTRGTVFAFRDPLWVTWPLARFADGLQDQTTPYLHSLALIRSLLDTLTTFPPLPSSTSPASSDPTASTPPEEDKARPRPKPEELQAAMSLLAVQPLIPGKGGEGPEAWEEVMSVEVGGWNEGR